jgi:hypothetical protein
MAVMNTLADRMTLHSARVEQAIKFANRNPKYRPQDEALIDDYFALIDEMAAELERRRMTGAENLES